MKLLKSKFVIISTLLFAGFFFIVPLIAEWVVSDPVYAKYADRDAPRIVKAIQKGMVYPFGKTLSISTLYWLIVPYYFLLFLLIRYLLKRFGKFWRITGIVAAVVLGFLYLFPNTLLYFENDLPSLAIGSVSNGSIKNAKRMNFEGENFTTYSFACYMLGRTFVHDKVRAAMLESYRTCEQSCPDIQFVVGEIGRKHGGSFAPHRTHRNGMSVDFMTPLLYKGKPKTSHHLLNLWGYRFEFDNKGKKDNWEIDYETTARHLLTLDKAAKKNGLRIKKVIFDPVLRPYLLATPTGQRIKHLPFTKNRVIIRHDDHYHVDFAFEK